MLPPTTLLEAAVNTSDLLSLTELMLEPSVLIPTISKLPACVGLMVTLSELAPEADVDAPVVWICVMLAVAVLIVTVVCAVLDPLILVAVSV